MIDNVALLKRFPKIELSYDKLIHNKVQSNFNLLIPQGNKLYIWFTYYNDKDLCILLHLNKYNIITNIETTIMSFDKKLSYGTILYGTYFNFNNTKYVTCEDIFYYKGEIIDHQEKNIKNRIDTIKNIFDKELQQIVYTTKSPLLGFPYITNTIRDAFNYIKEVPYPISHILCYDNKNFISDGIIKNKNNIKETFFKVKANIQEDLYNLYSNDSFYGYCLISDYKTSVMMNINFRNIKENRNLDLLEMSDSEEEFENTNIDKYVNTKKILYMKCQYVKKFRKWKPVEVVKFGEKLLTTREIKQIELER